MAINYIPQDSKFFITPSIKFGNDEGFFDALICYDGIVVAYLTGTGGIDPVTFEFDLQNRSKDDREEIDYLESKGVRFRKRYRLDRWVDYMIELQEESLSNDESSKP